MQDDKFEWHDEKARSNPQKHGGVTFAQAANVFVDRDITEYLDDNCDEERWNAVGFSGAKLLHVTYTWRGARRRIISAREAEPYEANEYFTRANRY